MKQKERCPYKRKGFEFKKNASGKVNLYRNKNLIGEFGSIEAAKISIDLNFN